MSIKPLHDRVLLKRPQEEEQMIGGIIVPDSAKEKPLEAEVIAVGGGKISDHGDVIPMSIKAGDRVLIGKYTGTEIKYNGEDLVIAREDEILAIVG